MKAPEISLDQFQLLRPAPVQCYLEQQEWKQQRCDPERHSVWRYSNEAGEEFVLLLPLNPDIPDFADRMYDLARVLALVEQRYLPDVFRRLLRISEGREIVDEGLPSGASGLELAIWEQVQSLTAEQQRQVLAFTEFLKSQGDRFSTSREAG
jgi:hypothetical protein